ncbi:MAG: dioxygenase [Calditrichaeota bacterium]|nr:MAG: dioxygenase [Calditrichota bacterium]
MPLLGDRDHTHMVQFLQSITSEFEPPAAILVVSAHWEARRTTITSGSSPALFYDYYGFPDEAYKIQYPAPGDPALADLIFQLLQEHEFDARLDAERGFDHGLFVPLKIMYPDAHIPCVQLSLVQGLAAETHIRVGKALSALRQKNVLILGSGFSFHNMQAFMSRGGMQDSKNDAFQKWLIDTCTDLHLSEQERESRLVHWESAPFARYCHPREEHLLPLHVCYGIAGTAAKLVFYEEILGKKSCAFLW